MKGTRSLTGYLENLRQGLLSAKPNMANVVQVGPKAKAVLAGAQTVNKIADLSGEYTNRQRTAQIAKRDRIAVF